MAIAAQWQTNKGDTFVASVTLTRNGSAINLTGITSLTFQVVSPALTQALSVTGAAQGTASLTLSTSQTLGFGVGNFLADVILVESGGRRTTWQVQLTVLDHPVPA